MYGRELRHIARPVNRTYHIVVEQVGQMGVKSVYVECVTQLINIRHRQETVKRVIGLINLIMAHVC